MEEFQPEESLHKAKKFISNLADISEQFKSHEQKLFTTLKNFDNVLVSIIEAKGTIGKLLMQKDFYTRLENALVKVESTLKNSEAITRDVKSASGKLPDLVAKVNQEMDQLRCILIDIRKASGQLPGLVETTDETVRTTQEVFDAVKANPLIKMTLPKSPPSEPIHLEPRDVP